MKHKIIVIFVLLIVLSISIVLSVFYGLTLSMKILFICMLADYLIGFSMALIGKSKSGKIQSEVGYKGLVKKSIMIFIVVIMGLIDCFLGQAFIQKAVTVGFIINELVSLSEYATVLGIPIDFIDFIKQKIPNKNNQNNEKSLKGGEKNRNKEKVD